jgi:hypothetical protein
MDGWMVKYSIRFWAGLWKQVCGRMEGCDELWPSQIDKISGLGRRRPLAVQGPPNLGPTKPNQGSARRHRAARRNDASLSNRLVFLRPRSSLTSLAGVRRRSSISRCCVDVRAMESRVSQWAKAMNCVSLRRAVACDEQSPHEDFQLVKAVLAEVRRDRSAGQGLPGGRVAKRPGFPAVPEIPLETTTADRGVGQGRPSGPNRCLGR